MIRIATGALAVAFLAAGAFSEAPHSVEVVPATSVAKVTLVQKNQAWPIKGLITVEPCKLAHCQEV